MRMKQASISLLVFTVCLATPLVSTANGNGSCVVSMSASLDSAVLIANEGSEVMVVSTPVPLVFVGDDGELKAVISITPSSGTQFTNVRISLSNISFTFLRPGGLSTVTASPSSLINLMVELDEDDEDDDQEEITPGQPASLELEFEPEDGLVPDGAGCFSGDFVADPSAAFEAELEDDANQQEELELAGEVVSVGSDSFVLNVAGTEVTIKVDGSTVFKNLSGLTALEAGDLVEVEVRVQFNGDLLAREVELLFDEDDEDGVTGRIAGVDPSSGAATSIQAVFAPSTEDHDFPAVTVQVNILGSTTYRVNAGNINTASFPFDASHLAVGQRVTISGTPFAGGATAQFDAKKIILKKQEVEGMLVDGSVNTSAGTFQLTLTSPTGVVLGGPLLVRADSRTRFSGGLRNLSGLNTTDTYEVKGLLMRNGTEATDVIFLAKKVKKTSGNSSSSGM